LQARRRVGIGGALQRLDIVFRLFHRRVVAGAGHCLHVAVGPGREPVVHLVEVGQLVAGLVDLPEIGVAQHDDDIVGPILGRHPGPHDRNVEVFRLDGVLVLIIGVGRVFRVQRLEDMRRAGAEIAISHLIEILLGEGVPERPFDGVIVDGPERRALAEGLR